LFGNQPKIEKIHRKLAENPQNLVKESTEQDERLVAGHLSEGLIQFVGDGFELLLFVNQLI